MSSESETVESECAASALMKLLICKVTKVKRKIETLKQNALKLYLVKFISFD